MSSETISNKRIGYSNFVAAALLCVVPSSSAAAEPSLFFVYRQANASAVIFPQVAMRGIAHQDICYFYQPRTALGKRLMKLRRAYIENGGALLDDAAFEAELRSRRGGVDA